MLAAAIRLFDDRRSKWNIGFFSDQSFDIYGILLITFPRLQTLFSI